MSQCRWHRGGVRHSEFNASNQEELHLLQIWILPEKKGIAPSYEQKQIGPIRNQLILIGSQHPTQQAVKIHQNIEIYVGYFDKDKSSSYVLNQQDVWIQVIRGVLHVNELGLQAGDGVWIQQETVIELCCVHDSEFLLFKMLFV